VGQFPGLNNRPDARSATIIDKGGDVLQHVQTFLVFWGSSWNVPSTPSRDEVISAVVNILTGPYMSSLAQYRGIGGGRLAGAATVATPDPPAPFSFADVQGMLTGQMDLHRLPQPTSSNQFFFCVIMPSGLLTSEHNAIGEHRFFRYSGFRVPFAWIMNDGSLNFVTTVLSHELVEACTDPSLDAILIAGGPGSPCPNTEGACEIGDVCSSTELVGGVQVQSYWSAADNRCTVPKNILRGEVAANPVLLQGRFLRPGNFELASALSETGLVHYSRVNSIDFVPWFGPSVFANNVGHFDAITLIQSNFTAGSHTGNLELAALFQSSLLYYWREDVPPYIWHGPEAMNGFQQRLFRGNPVLIQGRFEKRGNFELVVPLESGGIAHYSRVNDSPHLPWFGPNIFATDVHPFDAVTMVQTNWTIGPKIGLLELIGLVDAQLLFYFREDAPPFKWWGPLPQTGFQPRPCTGNPVMIQSRFGSGANLELIVPLQSGGLAHYWRDSSLFWSGPFVFGENVGRFDAVSLIQSDFSVGPAIGNLEVVARVGRALYFYWREDAQPFRWFGPRVVVAF